MAGITDYSGSPITDDTGGIITDDLGDPTGGGQGSNPVPNQTGFAPVTIPSVNVLSQMRSRILSQFANSPVFQFVLAAFAAQIQALEDAIQGVMQSFCPRNAGGVQLDAIGRIVGEIRGVLTVGQRFTPDSPYYGRPDSDNPVWVTNVPLSGTLYADDTTFRNYIFAKVFRNFTQVGSITDIQDFIRDMFGIESSVSMTGPMQIEVIVPYGTSPSIISFLSKSVTNAQADTIYMLPIPPGMQLAQVVAQLPVILDSETGQPILDSDSGQPLTDSGE